jgi:hypothetical protein
VITVHFDRSFVIDTPKAKCTDGIPLICDLFSREALERDRPDLSP